MKGFLRTKLANFLLLPNLVDIINRLRVQQEDSIVVLSQRCRELEHTVLALEGRISSMQARMAGMPDRRSVDRTLITPPGLTHE